MLIEVDLRFLRSPEIELLTTPEILFERIDFSGEFLHADARACRRCEAEFALDLCHLVHASIGHRQKWVLNGKIGIGFDYQAAFLDFGFGVDPSAPCSRVTGKRTGVEFG